ncbi:N-acetyltransferase [Alphaproteobacteria bacterium]|nr:N-acetyltransferase [Alphaproteobacteria bacterium]
MNILPYSPDWDERIEALLDISMGPGRRARVAERLRESNQQISEFAFIMVSPENELLATISFWPISIGSQPALLLGPLAVTTNYQGQGVGQTLMNHALNEIDKDQSRGLIVLLIGDLPYYKKSGFEVAPSGISMPGPVDLRRLLVRGEASRIAALKGPVGIL